MKQTKHKHCSSIWHRMPKGVRAGNSPVWEGDRESFGEMMAEKAVNTYTSEETSPKIRREIRRELDKKGKYLKD